MPEDPAQLLRAKAMLLIGREREVHEHRRDRSRIECWLRVFHELTLHLGTAEGGPLEERWVSAMVGELSFQTASVYASHAPERPFELVFALGPDAPRRELECDATLFDRFPSGHFDGGAPAELGGLAKALGLARFYWFSMARRGRRVLMLAGYREGAERFHAVRLGDGPHFNLLGSHLSALMENAELIAELDRERHDLVRSNLQLDVSVTQLKETQANLVSSSRMLQETSRRAGMADVATGVLHNVGNALNSVNVSAGLVAERLDRLRVDGVGRTAEVLVQNRHRLSEFLGEDSRGEKLVSYLGELGKNLLDEQGRLRAETASLLGHIEHIKAIVSKQQAYAMSFDLSQPCAPAALMDDAIELCSASLVRHEVEVRRDHEVIAEVMLDRHKVLQILVNLVTNAKQALSSVAREKRRISTTVRRHDGMLRFSVRDEGVGIHPEHLSRIFGHGFTTKADGHGFGLHASAVAARELGGGITCRSDGPGQGALFVVELPVRFVDQGG
jgi:signal transduction histidine kinase